MATTVGGGFVYTSIVGPQGLDSVSGSGPPSPVLLPNLVAGWSLTSGPQQTLSSAGVISGGALDFTNNGGVTFGAGGASLTAVKSLSVADTPVLEATISDSWFASLFFSTPDISQGSSILGWFGNDWELSWLSPDQRLDFFITSNGVVNPDVEATSFGPLTNNQVVHIGIWYDATLKSVNIQVNNGPVDTTVADPDFDPFLSHGSFGFGAMDGTVKLARFWKGSNARTIATNATWKTWLYNGGAGQFDADVAAYTG